MAKTSTQFTSAVKLGGDSRTVGSETVSVLLEDSSGNILWATGTTVPTNSTAGYAKGALFIDTDVAAGTDSLYQNTGDTSASTFEKVEQAGGGAGVGDLDGVYSNGSAVTVDEGAITLTDSTTGSANTLELVKDGAGSGNMLDLSVDAALTGIAIAVDMNLGIAANALFIDAGGTARTGSDILVTDDSTGDHSVIDINSSGSGATVGFDFTGSNNGSPGGAALQVTLDNTDNLDTTSLKVTRGTGVRTAPVIDIDEGSTGSADIIDIDVTGVYTGDVIDITTSAAATGNALFVNLDTAVAMTAIHLEGSGVRTQPFIELITDSTSSADLIDISVDGAITGNAIAIDMNAGLAANAINIDAGAGTRTANLIDITHDGDGNVDVMGIAATNTGSGAIFDINMGGAATGEVFNVDMDAAVGAALMNIDAGGGTRTKDLFDVTFDGDGNVGVLDVDCTNTGSGNLIDIDVTGIHAGDVLNIAYSSAASTGDAIEVSMGTNLAGSAIVLAGAGARTDDLIKIDDSSTFNSSILDCNLTGVFTAVAFQVDATAAHTAGLMKLTSDSSNTGARNLFEVHNDNTAAVGAIPLAVTQDALVDTNFKKVMTVGGFTIFVSDGTTAEGNLTGAEGDICLNGGTGAGQMAYCDADGTNWTDM